MTAAPLLQLGYVARAHGLQGEVEVSTFDPGSTSLEEVSRVSLALRSGEERVFSIRSCRSGPKGWLLLFDEVEGRTAAEGLVGARVFAFREDLPAPKPGEFFQGDLVGLEAVDETGASLGTVEEVWSTGPVPNLVVRKGEQELLVPFIDEFVPEVQLEAGRIVLRPPEYAE